jgi:3-oxoadipate enol-lactonase
MGPSAEAERIDTVRLGDIDVAYRAKGEGPAVAFIHGLAQDHRMWAPQQKRLSDFRTLAYDVRGHGGTSLGEADGTLAQLGGDLVAFLEHIGPASCVGFSLGGTVALWAAAERPDLVRDVVALATSSVVGRAAARFYAERIELFRSRNEDAVRAALEQDTRAQLAGDRADPAAIAAARMQAIGDRRGYVNAARAMAGIHEQPLNDRLNSVRCPVLVVSGEFDQFCPRRAAEIMLEHLPEGHFQELAAAGHLVTEENPDTVTGVIATWLRRERGT